MTATAKTPAGLPERVERGREVARLRTEGLTWPAVAASVGCSEKTIRRALAEHERVAPALALAEVNAEEVAARIIATDGAHDAAQTHGVYAAAMDLADGEQYALRALVGEEPRLSAGETQRSPVTSS